MLYYFYFRKYVIKYSVNQSKWVSNHRVGSKSFGQVSYENEVFFLLDGEKENVKSNSMEYPFYNVVVTVDQIIIWLCFFYISAQFRNSRGSWWS